MNVKIWRKLFYLSVLGLIIFMFALPAYACEIKTIHTEDGPKEVLICD